MAGDVLDSLNGYLTDDPHQLAKLASDVQWRRLQLLLLREILVELRKVSRALEKEGEDRGWG